MDTSHLAEHAGTAGTLFASVFVVATTTMRTMIPLRVFGILTNIVLIISSIPTHNYPTGLLHCVLLVMNSYRLHQMLQLVRDVKKSVNSDLSMDWLKPFMTERNCTSGEILFYKDEKAEDLFYIVSGRFRLVESGIELPVGAIVGELGMLSPSNVRTQSLECIEAGLILSVSYSKVEELYVQNPAFGFYFLRLSSARLFQKSGQGRRAARAVDRAGSRRAEAGLTREDISWPACSPRFVICSPTSSATTTSLCRRCRKTCRPALRQWSAKPSRGWSTIRARATRSSMSTGSNVSSDGLASTMPCSVTSRG